MGSTLSTPIVLGAISLIPYNRYILWTLGSVSLVWYAANRQRPSNKLGPLEALTDSLGRTLQFAKGTCARNYLELVDITREFLELKLSASNIRFRLLETHDVSTWKEFVEYVRHSTEIWQSIQQCEKKATEIRTSILCIIEAEHQRELSEEIQTSREIFSSLTRRASAVNRCIKSTGSYESMV
ncbi:hypothetical protein C8R45DRAFT_1028163 [Mycena sanguinolenta]|nr:hypothetical protein C8R45DRAFT_1028163 [Mycena sanguinolenta]